MTASRVSVELIITSFLFGLSQGLQLEDGTQSSTLQRIINWPSSGLGGLGEHNMEQYDLLFMSKGVKDEVILSQRNAGELSLVDYSPSEYDDKVILHGDVFKELFGAPRYKTNKRNKLLAVIKITNKNGESIHRAYLGKKGVPGFNSDHVALTHNSIRLLNGDDENPDSIKQVTISKGCRFLYYWNHPYHATRISMRLGMLSIVLTIILSLLGIIL